MPVPQALRWDAVFEESRKHGHLRSGRSGAYGTQCASYPRGIPGRILWPRNRCAARRAAATDPTGAGVKIGGPTEDRLRWLSRAPRRRRWTADQPHRGRRDAFSNNAGMCGSPLHAHARNGFLLFTLFTPWHAERRSGSGRDSVSCPFGARRNISSS